MTKNKWYRAFAFVMIPVGLFLTIMALVKQSQPVGAVPWIKFGQIGLMCIVGGIGLLFLPNNIKR